MEGRTQKVSPVACHTSGVRGREGGGNVQLAGFASSSLLVGTKRMNF